MYLWQRCSDDFEFVYKQCSLVDARVKPACGGACTSKSSAMYQTVAKFATSDLVQAICVHSRCVLQVTLLMHDGCETPSVHYTNVCLNHIFI